MKSAVVVIFRCLAIPLASLAHTASLEAIDAPSHDRQGVSQARRLSVTDYFNLLPSRAIGIGGATRRERREMLRAENHPLIDVAHDFLRVQPDSSPAEQIAVFRSHNKADLIAASMPDFQSDYNAFMLFRLQDGMLRDVTRQMLPMSPDTDHLLYELPRFGSTIRVFRFNLDTESRHHVFDLQWRGGHFVRFR